MLPQVELPRLPQQHPAVSVLLLLLLQVPMSRPYMLRAVSVAESRGPAKTPTRTSPRRPPAIVPIGSTPDAPTSPERLGRRNAVGAAVGTLCVTSPASIEETEGVESA